MLVYLPFIGWHLFFFWGGDGNSQHTVCMLLSLPPSQSFILWKSPSLFLTGNTCGAAVDEVLLFHGACAGHFPFAFPRLVPSGLAACMSKYLLHRKKLEKWTVTVLFKSLVCSALNPEVCRVCVAVKVSKRLGSLFGGGKVGGRAAGRQVYPHVWGTSFSAGAEPPPFCFDGVQCQSAHSVPKKCAPPQ